MVGIEAVDIMLGMLCGELISGPLEWSIVAVVLGEFLGSAERLAIGDARNQRVWEY